MKAVRILLPVVILIFVISCSDDGSIPPTTNNAKRTASTGQGDMQDVNAPTSPCWRSETTYEDGHLVTITIAVPCSTDTGGGGYTPPSNSTPTYPTTPQIYCAPASFPTAPKNGQKYTVNASGSTCLASLYFYSCAGGWVVPVSSIVGTPPTTNLYSGLHYAAEYNGTYITYVYLVNFNAGTGWYFQVSSVGSSGCNINGGVI